MKDHRSNRVSDTVFIAGMFLGFCTLISIPHGEHSQKDFLHRFITTVTVFGGGIGGLSFSLLMASLIVRKRSIESTGIMFAAWIFGIFFIAPIFGAVGYEVAKLIQ